MGLYLNRIKPWVTVICTAYNHEQYIADALQSVIDQHYPNVELIVIDNASNDQTVRQIKNFMKSHSAIHFIQNSTNIGLCQAFNQGLRLAKGKYIIDLSADDVMHPERVCRQVERFESLSDEYAVVFSNAAYIDSNNLFLYYHYPVDELGHSTIQIPTGSIFRQVLASYFICTPTMMIRKRVLDELGGYDETLAYEDFDFWVRSARRYKYAYLDLVLTKKRRLPNSLSMQVIKPGNQLLASTLIVCQKAYQLCQSPDEFRMLASRIRTFIRKAFYAEQYEIARQFGHLLRTIERPDPLTTFILLASKFHLPVNKLYRRYLHLDGRIPSLGNPNQRAVPRPRRITSAPHLLKNND